MATIAKQAMPMTIWAETRGASHAARKAFAAPTMVRGRYWTPVRMRLSWRMVCM